MSKIYFQEKQRFSQWWLWALLCVICFFIFKPVYKAISLNQNLSSDQWVGMIIIGLIVLLLLVISLEIKIDTNGIYVKFFPFVPRYKFFARNEIQNAFVRKYSPLREYGGWGYRIGGGGVAYNVKGNKGLQLKFKNGKSLLIGTQKPEELQRALDEFFE